MFVCMLISGSSAGQRHPRQRARRPGGGQVGWGRRRETISSGDGDPEQLPWGEKHQTNRWASGWNFWSGTDGQTLSLLVSCTITEMLRTITWRWLHFVCDCSVSDDDGQMKVTEVATRPLVQDLLDHEVSLDNSDVCGQQSGKEWKNVTSS